MVKPLVFEKPLGVRDYLPNEVRWKKEIEQRISSCIKRWGYQEIITPALEYYDTVGGSSNILQQRLYKLIDRDGKTLILRPDMTTPIARVVASLLKDEPLPIRLCYNTSIYRMQEQEAGKDAEFFQSGIELIGSDKPFADAEVVALAAESLLDAGLSSFKIAIGETSFLESFLEEKAASYTDELKKILIKQDYVGWKEYVSNLAIDNEAKDCLLELPKLQGGSDVIIRAKKLVRNTKALEALEYLKKVLELLEVYDISNYVHIDFTMLRGHNYYTGMIFEIYAPPVGFPICGGGRYNDLIAEFGRQAPAVGFGIWVERLIEALQFEELPADTYMFLFDEKDVNQQIAVIKAANSWRKQGYSVETISISSPVGSSIKNSRYIKVLSYEDWSVTND